MFIEEEIYHSDCENDLFFQMFGSVATMLDMTSKDSGMIDCRKVSILLSFYPLEYAW